MLGRRSNSITHRENFAQPSRNFCRVKNLEILTGFLLDFLTFLAVVSKRCNISEINLIAYGTDDGSMSTKNFLRYRPILS